MEIHDVATLVAVLVGGLAAVLAVANGIVIIARLTHRDLVAVNVARSVSRFTWWLRMADGGEPAASDLGAGPSLDFSNPTSIWAYGGGFFQDLADHLGGLTALWANNW